MTIHVSLHFTSDPRDNDMDMRGNGTRNEMMVGSGRPLDGRDRNNDRDEDREMSRDDRDRRGQRMRRPPAFCSELVCGPEEIEKCQEFRFDDGRPPRAFCIRHGKH